ncbi:stress responsive alpha/beta barrel protein [Algoriphagus ratkowskyi]|uniref:Dabb family protein n=1 Tax=Algoriphagus ratkowskyi TaxID=57028 RepID=A0A2W7RRQ7_9BACT|nr:Dabb family protein [Algoriphagus ratkowskyi]PZX53495.1 stress responsive alpha/beta barrel protein [Algoriphagus ratkowskyi]TXD76471.1 Dabb family protein [Algoriphagus ratkowskyi]
MLTHSVFFKLKFPQGSSEEREFLQAAAKLASIAGVQNFKSLRQLSSKNNFDYGLTMDFQSQEAYESYNKHPDHMTFVANF